MFAATFSRNTIDTANLKKINSMKNLLLILFFVSVTEHVLSQLPSWVWAKNAGSVSNDYSNASCTDLQGNIYITGTFQGSTINFGNYTLQNSGTGNLDIFIVKYDANGNVIWAVSSGGTNDDYAYGICSDNSGNIYVTGYFQSHELNFNTITIQNVDSSRDIFIAKFDTGGNVLWAKSAGNEDCFGSSFGICSDKNGNVFITGTFGYAKDIIFENDTLESIGSYDIFIAKYDEAGNYIWAKNMGGTQTDQGNSICADSIGNIYITGFYCNSAIFGNISVSVSGYCGIYIAKLDTYGTVLWAKSPPFLTYSNYEGSHGIATSGNSVYITGYFQHPVIFGGDTLGNAGNKSIFLAKYDTAGNPLWGRCPGGTGSDYGQGICTDENGNIYITGYFGSSYLNFGGIPLLNSNVGYNDIFIVGYDSNGNTLWAKSLGGTDYDYGMSLCVSGNNIYATGYFGSYDLNFGIHTITSSGSYDVYLAKLDYSTGIEENNELGISIFPNPSNGNFTIRRSSFKMACTIDIYNLLGEKVYSELISSQQKYIDCKLSKGTYFVQIIEGQNQYTKKIMIQ